MAMTAMPMEVSTPTRLSMASGSGVDDDDALDIPSSVRLRHHWEGYLQKRSDWLKHWETYYFVLRGRLLYCYLTEEDARQQPEKSKIKKGKFGFADRVTLTRVWDIEETSAAPATTTSPSNGTNPPPSPASSASAATSTALASPFRFTFETDKGHQLHFRTNSDASKFMWLHVAANAIADYDANGSVRPAVRALRTSVDDFYRAYEYFAAALSDLFIVELLGEMDPSSFAFAAQQSTSSVSTTDASSSKSSKIQSTLMSVASNQPMRRTRIHLPLDRIMMRFFSFLSPDVTLRSNYLPMVPFEGKYRGFNGILEYFTRVADSARFEQFCVERIELEEDETGKNNRILVISGRETMQVRYNHATFMQQWTHKLHFKPNGGGLVSRWEIFGDVVASSVVFKAPGFTTNLTLPSLSERIRESFVGGYIVSIHLQHVSDVKTKDRFFVRCSLDTNEFDGVWHTEAQSKAVTPIEVPLEASDAASSATTKSNGTGASSPNASGVANGHHLVYVFNQLLYLQFDRLSRDDNTLLLMEFCRESNHEVVARTFVNLASYLNKDNSSDPKRSRRRRSSTSQSTANGQMGEFQNFVLANDHQSFFGKLVLGITISSLSAARQQRRSRQSASSVSSSSSRRSFPWRESNSTTTPRGSMMSDTDDHESDASASAAVAAVKNRLRALTTNVTNGGAEQENEVMHQFVISGVRYQLAEKYRMVKIVGKGTYGEVIAASDFVNGGTYAIKKLPQFLRHPKVAMLALREIKLMNELGAHPCLMGIHELQKPLDYDHFEDLYIIQPLMEMDLCRIIHSKEHLSDDQVQFFIYQLLCGIHYLHSANVLHRDLKPSNVLVNSDCRLKVIDFGLARHANDRDLAEGLSEYVVTRWYRAPELLLANSYTKAVDMWSIGCILGELLGRRVLFPGSSYVDQLKVIVEVVGTPKTFSFCDNPVARRYAGRQFLVQSPPVEKVDWQQVFPEANPEALDLLDKLLQFDPAKRITAAQALEHPYVSPWRDSRLEQPCRENVAAQLGQFDYSQLPWDPQTLKDLLYEEVMKTNERLKQREQQRRSAGVMG
ncbi:hypothetical protein Poli38472_001024 [Pythium oligandrum]|uniref:CMGC/MAPK protein kinase n=1 Tax=Pythium oligandrum TaxID=41045 RepID=A0A8K1CTX0_PYTOL|nr:hypothetical protein Poli38472_001024 [Pythium oligandrum]|eukprot:TMW68868.1 hypothetical protein Poli38472_001024 [Pythium oligandrum]